MTDQAQAWDRADWAAIETRGRRSGLVAALGVTCVVAAMMWLSGQHAFWPRWIDWADLGGPVVVLRVGAVTSKQKPRQQAKSAAATRIDYATRHHLDPGPELGTRADLNARHLTSLRWFPWWAALVVPLGPLFGAPWSRLLTGPAALLTAAGALVWARWWQGPARDARRWIADAPGSTTRRSTSPSQGAVPTSRLLPTAVVGVLVIGVGIVLLVRIGR